MGAEKTLEDKLKEKFPMAKKANKVTDIDCIVVPMTKGDLVMGKLNDLVEVIKEYESNKGYRSLKVGKGVYGYMFYFGDSKIKEHVLVDGMFPGQVNIYYSEGGKNDK